MQPDRLLLLSDGKPGHLNQSIAFAKHLGCKYDICAVTFSNRFAKAVSYLADRCYLRFESLCRTESFSGIYRAVVSTGSETYYANRVVASRLGIKSVAIMLPKGYRYDFDLIVAQQHDDPPEQENIVCLLINMSYVEPQGIVTPEAGHRYVSLIVGGDTKHASIDADHLREQVKRIMALFPDHDFWMTTSRRTSVDVEEMLREFNFSRAVFYSVEQLNPIPDFVAHSEYLFLTADSTSMISEAVSYGSACVEVLPFKDGEVGRGKLLEMVGSLQATGSLHLFDGTIGSENCKIDLAAYLGGIVL